MGYYYAADYNNHYFSISGPKLTETETQYFNRIVSCGYSRIERVDEIYNNKFSHLADEYKTTVFYNKPLPEGAKLYCVSFKHTTIRRQFNGKGDKKERTALHTKYVYTTDISQITPKSEALWTGVKGGGKITEISIMLVKDAPREEIVLLIS